MTRHLRPALALFLLAIACVLLGGAATVQSSASSPYRRGETIEITGTVADAAGTPVEGMTVALVAAHRGFALPGLRRVEQGAVRVKATTDSSGAFALPWRWDSYYDTFRIRAEGAGGQVTTSTAGGNGPAASVLAEIDLSRRILEGSPVVVALEVADAGAHRQERSFQATTQSDDQKRIFEEMGKPDRVDRLEMSGGDEVAWWYFGRGKSFHFRDGRLDQVVEFDPVKGF